MTNEKKTYEQGDTFHQLFYPMSYISVYQLKCSSLLIHCHVSVSQFLTNSTYKIWLIIMINSYDLDSCLCISYQIADRIARPVNVVNCFCSVRMEFVLIPFCNEVP